MTLCTVQLAREKPKKRIKEKQKKSKNPSNNLLAKINRRENS